MASRDRADHYAVLGVPVGASTEEIRRAYRERARAAHPDVAAGDPEEASRRMAAINAAWACLSDPIRRADYDVSRGDCDVSRGEVRAHAGAPYAWSRADPWPSVVSRDDGPARIPWRAMRWMLAIGVAAVIGLSFVSTESVEAPPDQLLQAGSCVVIDETDAVSEVSCAGEHDAVVRQLVAFDRTCPTGTETFRDRQGMGLACVERAVGGTEGGG